MAELSDIIKKAVSTLGVIGISYGSLEAQHRTGTDYIQSAKPDRYQVHCLSNKGRTANMNKYEKAANKGSCKFNSRKNLNSKEYSPLTYQYRNDCISRSSKRYEKGYNKIRRKNN